MSPALHPARVRGPQVIETPRLRLRPCREEDKSAFVRLLNTPRMMAALGGVTDDAAIVALIDKRIADQARHGFSYWAVELRDGGALIGTCGLRIADNYAGTPVAGLHEAGWRIGEDFWGRGFALEAAAASLAWAWTHTAARLVAAWTTAGNQRSLAVMARLGMTRRPELDFARDDGSRMIVHAIDRPEPWTSRPRADFRP